MKKKIKYLMRIKSFIIIIIQHTFIESKYYFYYLRDRVK